MSAECAVACCDLIIRNGTVVTATVGIRDGKIAVLGNALGPDEHEIVLTGKLVMSGGVDSHCHIEQPRTDGTAAL